MDRIGMTDRIVDQVKSRLAVQVDTNRGGDSNFALHLELELSKKTGLLPSHSKRHVLTFTGAEASIPNQLALLT